MFQVTHYLQLKIKHQKNRMNIGWRGSRRSDRVHISLENSRLHSNLMSNYFVAVSSVHKDRKHRQRERRATKDRSPSEYVNLGCYLPAKWCESQESRHVKCGLIWPCCFVLGSCLVQVSKMTTNKNLFYPYTVLLFFFLATTKSFFFFSAFRLYRRSQILWVKSDQAADYCPYCNCWI